MKRKKVKVKMKTENMDPYIVLCVSYFLMRSLTESPNKSVDKKIRFKVSFEFLKSAIDTYLY